MKVVSLLLQNQLNLPASTSLSLKSKRLRDTHVRAEADGDYLTKNGQTHAMCGLILHSEKHLSVLYKHIHYGVERIHKSAVALVKNNLLFFNIFIDMLNNKIQVLINTSVQDKFMSNNKRRMIQVAVIHR